MSNIFRSFNPIGSQLFTSSGTFIVPASITRIILLGAGGGQGGQAGGTTNPGQGGIGVCPQELILSVTPGSSWTVTIGGGGAGVAGVSSAGPSAVGGAGGASFFIGTQTYTFNGSGTTANVFSPTLITTANNVASLYAAAGASPGGGGGGGGYGVGGAGSANGAASIGANGGLSAGGGGGGQHAIGGQASGAGGSGFILVTW
jgi:hypothetical protein